MLLKIYLDEELPRWLETEIMMDVMDFDEFLVRQDTSLTFTFKDFKVIF